MKNKINCAVEGCLQKIYGKGICRKHYDQKINNRGIFRDFSKGRKRHDPNEFRLKGNICFIFLYNKQNIKIAETIIDIEDYNKCSCYKWYGEKDHSGDIRAKSTKIGYLSHFIIGFRPNNTTVVVDHKDGNTLNNKKENLQVITGQQNQWKKKKQKNNTSGYRGVFWDTNCNKWRPEIVCDGKKYVLGHFIIKEEAALIYNEKAKELFNGFAVLNKISQSEQNFRNRLCKKEESN